MKLNINKKQIVIMIISLLCIIISFIVGALFEGIVSMCIEYGCIGIALILLMVLIINKIIIEKHN